MEHFAVISGWSAVDAASFPAVHKAQGNGVGLIYVLPKVALTFYAVVLLAVQPARVSTSLLVASLGALAISWAITALHQLPIQRRIRKAKDQAAVARLYTADLGRVAAMIAHNAFVVVLMARAL
jgi:L-asparagine transporter-like permease